MNELKEIPDSYEVIEHHQNLSLHDSERRIMIMVIERDEFDRNQLERFPYKVSAAENQKTKYEGVFDSQSHAESKVRELAHEI